MQAPGWRTTTATSDDGTEIGYRSKGQGPSIVLLHGSMESGLNHLALGEALSTDFTVHLPDRRGRGLSGPHRPGHGIDTEVADLTAVIARTDAERLFGVSAGGLIALETARRNPTVKKAALYEPALVDEATPFTTTWIERFDREIAESRIPAAMVTSMIGLSLGPPILRFFPRPLLARLTDLMLRGEDKAASPDDVTMRRLAPTIGYEGVIIGERHGTEKDYADVAADVLLLSGSKGLPWLRPGMAALERILPTVRRIDYPGLDHGGSSDVTKANPKGRPDLVAADLATFYRS